MSKIYLTNSFSINMLPQRKMMRVTFERLTPITLDGETHDEFDVAWDYAQACERDLKMEIVPAIGHEDLARIVETKIAGCPWKKGSGLYARPTIEIEPGDRMIVFQYRGPRLPEGATQLPKGAEIVPYLLHFEVEFP